MEKELISKKELLELTKISYGQLYRWKRKNLIPEEWFIRKSTYTGQETFFPKERIMDRIEKIKDMKGDVSLDDLANMLSPNLSELMLKSEDLINLDIISKNTLDFYIEKRGKVNELNFEKILYLSILDNLFDSGKINFDEGILILNLLEEFYPKYKGKNCELLFLRKLGISSCCLVSNSNIINFDNSMKIVENLNLTDLIEELKIKLV
ncbi:MAG: YhbD family protein [Methanobacterium sp.]